MDQLSLRDLFGMAVDLVSAIWQIVVWTFNYLLDMPLEYWGVAIFSFAVVVSAVSFKVYLEWFR